MQDYIFDDEKRSIKINRLDLPSPWINYISNGNLHGFVSQAGGGMLWLGDDPSKCRLTRYRHYNIPIDSPGFYIYIREKDGTVWSPAFRPLVGKADNLSAEHFPGKTVFYAEKDGTQAKLTLFIAPDYDTCIWNLEFCSSEDKNFDVFAYMEFSQYNFLNEVTNGYYWRHMLKTWFDEKSGSVQYLYHRDVPDPENVPLVYFASDRKIESYSGDRDAFLGNYRSEDNPISVERGYCGNETLSSGEPCGALHIKIECKKEVSEKASFFVGVKPGGMINVNNIKTEIYSELKQLRTETVRIEQERKLDMQWEEFLNKFKCDIPDKAAQRQINIWGPVASVHTARYSRSINATAPGTRGMGYRDTCQDMLAITYRNADAAEKILLHLLRHQYASGNAVHGIPDKDNPNGGDVVIRCDDHLWPIFLAYSLLAETGDFSLLKKRVPYLAENNISENGEGNIWEHLLKAVHFTQNNLGSHGLPLTYGGDWNDIIFKFSTEGRGESVFAAQQYVRTLEMMLEVAQYIGDVKAEDMLKRYIEKQRENILQYCWNGKWWNRCFDDNGNPIGCENNEYGKIWLNSQTWSVISNSGTREMQRKAMDAVNKMLDTGVGLMKLAPGFETWPEVTDPFSGYNPGTGENGAVFCHAHTWAIIAEAILGNAERAWKYYNDLVPHNAIQKLGIERYKAEPYTWCSNIVGYPNNKQGWGNISHISGTVAWMNVAATQYLLGIRPVIGGIVFDPCIPSEWNGFEVNRLYRGCMLNIKVDNSLHTQKGVKKFEVDGVVYNGNYMSETFVRDKKEINIYVIMGDENEKG